MRLEDIRLRDAARNGDAKACNEIAVRLFSGSNGFGRNFKLGLAYLQHALLKKVPSAILLAGEAVPLDILMAQGCRDTLAEAARLGSSKSRLKLGIWMMLRRDERGEGARWIKLSEGGTRKWDAVTFDDPGELVTLLKSIASCDLVDRSEVPLSGALCALKDLSIHDACYCLRAGAQLGAERERFAELVFLTVQLAASRGADLDLPVDLIESSLWSRAEQGEVEAQYALGRALAGSAYGHLKWDQLARRVDVRSSAALLLRAAHGGKREAWLDLAEMAPGYTTSCGNREMARFFLERAAESGLVEAQRKLGTALLKDATSVERAEVGVYWLSQAAGKGDTVADELLRTLVLPLPELSAEYENTVIERIRAISPDLGARIALARALHLTRREAMTFNAKQNIRPWGLVMRGTSKENPKGRLAPSVTLRMKAELERAASFFNAASTSEDTLVHQRSRAQKQIFSTLSISESHFFAEEIGRSFSHYGFGRHWAVRAAPLIRTVLGDSRRDNPASE